MVSVVNAQSYANLRNVEEPVEGQKQACYVSCRGGSYERAPEYDIYEKKKGNAGGVIAGIVGVLGVGSAVWAFCRGKKVAGEEKFFKKLGEGYKDIWQSTRKWVVETFKRKKA